MSNNKNAAGRRAATTLTLCAALFLAGEAAADQYHYNNILIGDRASGMGGAYTAISDDPSGLYYNPAGIAFTDSRKLSGSVNAYHVVEKEYGGLVAGQDYVQKSSVLVPNFFGVTQPLGGGVVGFSYVVPDSISEDIDTTFRDFLGVFDELRFNLRNQESVYKVGPSYAHQLGDRLQVGATLYLHVRNQEEIINLALQDQGVPYYTSYVQTQSEEMGVEPVLGLIWSPLDELSIGLSLRRTQIFHADNYGTVTCNDYREFTGFPFCDARGSIEQSDSGKRKYPLRTALGIAYFPSSSLLLSLDVVHYDGGSDPTPWAPRSFESVLNVAAGAEYYLTPQWALRGGVFTDRSNATEGTEDEHVDYVGGSLSVTRFTRNSSITLGVSYARGDGEVLTTAVAGTVPQAVDASKTTLSLSSSYSF